MEHANVSRGRTGVRHRDIIRGLALGLVLVACTRADSVGTAENREQSGAARKMVPPDARPANARPPADARPAPRRVEHISAGREHTCVLFAGGSVRCWGKGAGGRLGTGSVASIGDDETPATIPDVALGGRAVQITAGHTHTCALLDTGRVRCWGDNAEGQLGYGHTRDIGDDEAPASAGDVTLDEPVTQIIAGDALTCALLASGRVRCWGNSSEGETGHGLDHSNIGDDEEPTAYPALELGGRVTQIASSYASPCALLEGGSVRCWGPVAGSGVDRYTPAAEHPLVALGVPAMGIISGVGGRRACAITAAGRLRCWGGGVYGLVGYAYEIDNVGVTPGDLPTPAKLGDVPLAGDGRVVGIAPGGGHTCALLDTGKVRCWGANEFGVLGPGGPERVRAKDAVEIDVGGRVAEIAAGAFFTCAVLDTGRVRCWGDNADGQLGYGTSENVGEKRSPAAAGDVPL
jgi:alpha-tubulin suppressor-like RCC1 family protein